MSKTRRIARRVAMLLVLTLGLGWSGCDDNPSGSTPPDPNAVYDADTLIVREILDTNGLSTMPLDSVAAVADGRVTSLDLSHRGLTILPSSIGGLSALQALYLHGNALAVLPDSITGLSGLSTLTVGGNRLCDPSTAVRAWLDTYVTLSGWRDRQLCASYATDSVLVRAILDANGLFDRGVIQVCDTANDGRIVRLLLAHRALRVIPDDIGGLLELETLDLHDNRLADLPETLATIPTLTTVDLEYNRLCSLSTNMARWADSLAPGWRAFQDCSSGVRDTALFGAGNIDSVAEGDGRWLVIETHGDSLVIDSILVTIDSAMPPVRVSFRPIGVPAYAVTADTVCVMRSHGQSYGDGGGSAIIRVPPNATAYLVDADIQTCLECSSDTDVPPIRDGDSLRAGLRFHYRRCYGDTTVYGAATVAVTGAMNAQTIAARTPLREWFIEIYLKDAPHETVDFDSLPDTCESYLDKHNEDPFDVAFSPDSIGAPAGITQLGVVDTTWDLLPCRKVDSVAAVVAAERFAFVQAGYAAKAPLAEGGVYWLRTMEGASVLLVNTYKRHGAYDRYQFLWARYE